MKRSLCQYRERLRFVMNEMEKILIIIHQQKDFLLQKVGNKI